MLTAILQKSFSAFIAILAFFFNTFSGLGGYGEAPGGAERFAYGDGNCEFFDLYIPETVSDETDVLLLVHGGAWMMGDGSEFNADCIEASANYGYITVNMDYSKFQNGATAADMVDEIAACLNKASSVLADKGIDADKLIICGHSAGAHLSLLYAYQHYADCPFDIGFVVSNCAPAEFLSDANAKSTTMGRFGYLALTALSGHVVTSSTVEENDDYINAVTPISLVTPQVPPTLVIQGNADEMVPYENSTKLYDALVRNGVDTLHITYEGAGHFLGDEFEDGNARRAEAFRMFASKYCAN